MGRVRRRVLPRVATPSAAPAGFNPAGEVTNLIGTGPFSLCTLDAPRSMALARNDRYWGRKAAAVAVRYDAVTIGETRAMKKSGAEPASTSRKAMAASCPACGVE